MLLVAVANEEAMDRSIIFFMVAVAIGNGGYYALGVSQNLSEAILASKIIYVIGVFAPMSVFAIICNICKVRIPKWANMCMYTLQMVLFLFVCTIGRNTYFYKTVEFHMAPSGSYLTKTYGPMHTVYLITLMLYTIAGAMVGLISLNRKSVVSRTNVYAMVFADALAVGLYLIERVAKLEMELMPICFTILMCIMIVPLIYIYTYSTYTYRRSFEEQLSNRGFIVVSRNLKYMGCNEYGMALFPELAEWEFGKKLPGNGGRFNTFLRQPLLNFSKLNVKNAKRRGTYEYKGEVYQYELSCLCKDGWWIQGYIIQISNITELVKADNG